MVKTIKEWKDEIKTLALDTRTPDELAAIGASAAAKRIRTQRDLQEIQLFPDAWKKQKYDYLVLMGAIEPDTTSLSLTNQAILEKAYQEKLQSYAGKIDRLTQFVAVSNKAIELENGAVLR